MTKTAERTRITAFNRILRNAKKHYDLNPRVDMEFLKYANTVDGIQYVCDGYKIIAFKKTLPFEEKSISISLNYELSK